MSSGRLRLLGHACFELQLPTGELLIIDPYAAGDFGGRVALRPLEDRHCLAVATHMHRDHAAFDAIPNAGVIAAPYADAALRMTAIVASHDEFGGRLRGGLVQILCIEAAGSRIAFCGDLGERPTRSLLAQLLAFAPDILVIPVGGYFTLDADGAAELVALLHPSVVVPCHSADDGTTFAELGGRSLFTQRFRRVEYAEELLLPRSHDGHDTVVVCLRPMNAR